MARQERELRGMSVTSTSRPGDSPEKKARAASKLLRDFKKMVQREGIVQEYRDRQFFVKPSEVKRKNKAAQRRRWLKRQQELESEKWGE